MTQQHAQLQFPELIDIPTLAARLGVGVRHVRRLVAERRIPFVKWGHLIRFDVEQVEAWLKEAERPVLPRD
jgi:excisionase family DNA binding protein